MKLNPHLVPVFDANVHEFMQILGDVSFYAWLFHAVNKARGKDNGVELSALVLFGPPGTGKSVLGQGLDRLFGGNRYEEESVAAVLSVKEKQAVTVIVANRLEQRDYVPGIHIVDFTHCAEDLRSFLTALGQQKIGHPFCRNDTYGDVTIAQHILYMVDVMNQHANADGIFGFTYTSTMFDPPMKGGLS